MKKLPDPCDISILLFRCPLWRERPRDQRQACSFLSTRLCFSYALALSKEFIRAPRPESGGLSTLPDYRGLFNLPKAQYGSFDRPQDYPALVVPLASRSAQDQANPACPRRFWRRKPRVSPLWRIARTGLFPTWGTLTAPSPMPLMRSLTVPVCSQLLTKIARPQQTFLLPGLHKDAGGRKGHLGAIRRPRDKRFGSSAFEKSQKRTA